MHFAEYNGYKNHFVKGKLMFLEKMQIVNFRSIKSLTLYFNKGLNVLIGENNTGKTTVLDAIRIALSFGNLKRDIYIIHSDFLVEKDELSHELKDIEFHLFFHIDIFNEQGWFNELLTLNEDGTCDLQLHFRYYIDDNERIRYRVWGGKNEGQQISPEVLYLLYHIHLDALRDAEQCLRPIRGNRLGQLYTSIKIDADRDKDQEKKKEIAKKIFLAIESDPDWVSHISKGKDKINEHLNQTSISGNEQIIDVMFLPFDFNKLVNNLKIQIPIYSKTLLGDDPTQQEYFDLFQNGLGYNNLIYIATVLGDLKQRKESQIETYAALLIEEPEAHLHPQLQNVFFEYLNKLDVEHGFQLFISSHSPTITAKANLDSLIVLQKKDNSISALSLKYSGLSPDNRDYLHKFLDVTKAQLFFSTGVILVEGISELLLMPIFSKIMSEEYNIIKAGIELININGVAFSHFALLFNNYDENKNLISKCSLITDDDSDQETEEISSRAIKAKELEKNNLRVFLSRKTFEYELFVSGNNELLMKIFTEMHPFAAGKIDLSSTIEKNAMCFLEKIISNKAKSELSHRLAILLERDEIERKKFIVPQYIQEAIRFVIKG